jgi:signal transduction histidine kinase
MEPALEEAYADETARLVAARLPILLSAFAVVITAAWGLEYLAHPERVNTYGIFFALELTVGLIALRMTHSPGWEARMLDVVTVCCATLCILMGAYNALVGGEGEGLALGQIGAVTCVAVLLPLGVRRLAIIATAALLSYAGAIVTGATSHASVPLTALGIGSIGTLAVAGGGFLDENRWTSFRRACELQEVNTALSSANAAKNLFLANMSHELRTPLNVVLGYAHLMLDGTLGPTPEPFQQPLNRIVASAESLVDLISDLLDLSRIEAGQLAINVERVDLRPLFDELAAVVQPLLANKPVRFVRGDTDGLAVIADRTRLRQVLINLLSNASKFTQRGEIRLRAEPRRPNRVQIDVSDTGIGIPTSDLSRIFEPFQRSHKGKDFAGVGIGLSISRRLTANMGGELVVDSAPNRGATFSVLLPAAA